VPDSKAVTVTHRQIAVSLIVIVLIAGAFFLGRATVTTHNSTASLAQAHKATPATPPATTVVSTTTTSPPTTTTQVSAGPTLATCTNAVANYGNTLSTEQVAGYACANQGILSEAIQSVRGSVVNSDVIIMVREVCNNYPQAPLCLNG
jgi:hypothetical protein